MKGRLISLLTDYGLRRTTILLVVAFILIIISLFGGGVGGKTMVELLFYIGLALLFYALLHPWDEMSHTYYVILMAVSLILFVLLFIVGIDILVKIFNHGHSAEDVAWSFGFICIAGFFAGLIGLVI